MRTARCACRAAGRLPLTTANARRFDPSFFKLAGGPAAPSLDRPTAVRATAYRVEIRALEGMQKEAIVTRVEPAGSAWRMVSDEGPYLNGTDLAPFPLAFFTSGQQFCLLEQMLRLAAARSIPLDSVELAHDNRYTMAGSILRGDMTGGARPAETVVKIESNAPAAAVAALTRDATAASAGQAIMRDILANRFSLTANDRRLPVEGLATVSTPGDDPVAAFETLRPAGRGSVRSDIMTKVETVETRHGVTGGAGSSLAAEQRRTLHVRGDARRVDRTLLETTIRLFQPLGSSFRLIAELPPELGGADSAPPPLAYLSAGIGFCFMTQLGRYAQIVKQRFDGVRIRQDTRFGWGPDGVIAEPVDTHVFLETGETDDAACQLVRVGEQTCFLHAACRETHPSVIAVELNGQPLSPLAPADVSPRS